MRPFPASTLRSFIVDGPAADEGGRGDARSGDRPPRNLRTPLRPHVGMIATWDSGRQFSRLRVAVIDGPYSAIGLSGKLARNPVSLGGARCAVRPKGACNHGTFVLGLLGARRDAPIPGLCPDCELLHIALFSDEDAAQTSMSNLALGISDSVAAGASLINLSLAVLTENGLTDEALAMALNRAETAGAVIMAAAGNQGRMTASQILSHPVTIPVAAMDASGNLLPDSNFGPLISLKGVAALGHQVRGYAPDGGTTVMSGTSVAAAVATGIVAQAWSTRPSLDGATVRAAIARLTPRTRPVPPMLNVHALIDSLDEIGAKRLRPVVRPQIGAVPLIGLQGGTTMGVGNGPERNFNQPEAPRSVSGGTVAPAHGAGACACGGALNGTCTCIDGGTSTPRFVYVLGTVDVLCPDQSVADEFQEVARTIGVSNGDERGMLQRDDESLRDWYHRVLMNNPEKPGPRYIARQLCWVLRVEKQPAYYLSVRDWQELDDLTRCLGEPVDHDLTLLVGTTSMAYAETCPGVRARVLQIDQVCAYQRKTFLEWCGAPTERPPSKEPTSKPKRSRRPPPGPAAAGPGDRFESLYKRLIQSADNYGDTDEWRALNYLAVRCSALYQLYAQKVGSGDYLLDSIKVPPSRLLRERRIVDPVFTFVRIGREGGTREKYFFRIDVTYLFPSIIYAIEFDRDGTRSQITLIAEINRRRKEMFQLAPIDKDFVPYSRRPVRKTMRVSSSAAGGAAGQPESLYRLQSSFGRPGRIARMRVNVVDRI